jgi:hypothetical protein
VTSAPTAAAMRIPMPSISAIPRASIAAMNSTSTTPLPAMEWKKSGERALRRPQEALRGSPPVQPGLGRCRVMAQSEELVEESPQEYPAQRHTDPREQVTGRGAELHLGGACGGVHDGGAVPCDVDQRTHCSFTVRGAGVLDAEGARAVLTVIRTTAVRQGPLVAISPPLDGRGPGSLRVSPPELRVRPTHPSLGCDELGGRAWHQFAARDTPQGADVEPSTPTTIVVRGPKLPRSGRSATDSHRLPPSTMKRTPPERIW